VDEPGLDRLVAAVDGVGADAALAVVDDGALVVGAQQDERPVDLEERRVVEPLDAPIGLSPVADHPPETLFDGVHHVK
jgi:hypothetical protein